MWGVKCDLHQDIRLVKAGKFQTRDDFQHQRQCNPEMQLIVNLGNPLYLQLQELRYVIDTKDWFLIPTGIPFFAYQPTTGGCVFYWLHFQTQSPCPQIDETQALEQLLL